MWQNAHFTRSPFLFSLFTMTLVMVSSFFAYSFVVSVWLHWNWPCTFVPAIPYDIRDNRRVHTTLVPAIVHHILDIGLHGLDHDEWLVAFRNFLVAANRHCYLFYY